MKLTQWLIRGKVYSFPKKWSKKKVVKFCNSSIRVCEICGKVDVPTNHYENCNVLEYLEKIHFD